MVQPDGVDAEVPGHVDHAVERLDAVLRHGRVDADAQRGAGPSGGVLQPLESLRPCAGTCPAAPRARSCTSGGPSIDTLMCFRKPVVASCASAAARSSVMAVPLVVRYPQTYPLPRKSSSVVQDVLPDEDLASGQADLEAGLLRERPLQHVERQFFAPLALDVQQGADIAELAVQIAPHGRLVDDSGRQRIGPAVPPLARMPRAGARAAMSDSAPTSGRRRCVGRQRNACSDAATDVMQVASSTQPRGPPCYAASQFLAPACQPDEVQQAPARHRQRACEQGGGARPRRRRMTADEPGQHRYRREDATCAATSRTRPSRPSPGTRRRDNRRGALLAFAVRMSRPVRRNFTRDWRCARFGTDRSSSRPGRSTRWISARARPLSCVVAGGARAHRGTARGRRSSGRRAGRRRLPAPTRGDA